MRHIELGRSGLDVSPVVIGAMSRGETVRGHLVRAAPYSTTAR